jgi:hypothetical protein
MNQYILGTEYQEFAEVVSLYFNWLSIFVQWEVCFHWAYQFTSFCRLWQNINRAINSRGDRCSGWIQNKCCDNCAQPMFFIVCTTCSYIVNAVIKSELGPGFFQTNVEWSWNDLTSLHHFFLPSKLSTWKSIVRENKAAKCLKFPSHSNTGFYRIPSSRPSWNLHHSAPL